MVDKWFRLCLVTRAPETTDQRQSEPILWLIVYAYLLACIEFMLQREAEYALFMAFSLQRPVGKFLVEITFCFEKTKSDFQTPLKKELSSS